MKHGDRTKRAILEVGLKLWHADSARLTHRNVAKALGMTHPAIFYHFLDLRSAVAAYAVQIGDSHIIVQLMALKHPAVKKLSDADRRRHARVVSG